VVGELKKCVATLYFFFSEFVFFREDTNLISYSEIPVLGMSLEGLTLCCTEQRLLTRRTDSSRYLLCTVVMVCGSRIATVTFKINWKGGWVGLRAGLEPVVKKKISIPVWNRIPVLLTLSS
jgi:hypothetical protein